jgi:hypothetical protein
MKDLSIKVIDRKIRKINNLPSCWGEITIGGFREKFVMPLVGWKIEDYEKQWQEGLKRIKTENQSCLIVSFEDYAFPLRPPLINWWILYKVDNKIFIQAHMLFGEYYKEKVGNKEFNAQTCYQFIEPRQDVSDTGDEVSEWCITLDGIEIDKDDYIKKNKLSLKDVSIYPIARTIKNVDGVNYCHCELKIGDYTKKFGIPLIEWTIEDYEKQWKEGLERIKTQSQSCLIKKVNLSDKEFPIVGAWVLYKEDNTIYIQDHHLLYGKIDSQKLINRQFTLQNCYDFIRPRKVPTPNYDIWELAIQE